MKNSPLSIGSAILLLGVCAGNLPAQQDVAVPSGGNPVYRVEVVQRSTQAVNYQYRSDPTMIDFKGTLLLPRAKGEATVQSLPGRTEIDARFDGLESPQHYGTEYLTYVLWAITPEGRAHNIGELIPDAGNHAKLHVTTDLQAFALILTAEPYAAVRQPSDVVVAENEIRPDTVGRIEPVNVKYELLPRGQYTWMRPNPADAAVASAPKVSVHEYEAQTELYQAQNAIAIANAAQASVFASDTLAKANELLSDAQRMHDHHGDFRMVVQYAREATQTAEDARTIAIRKQQDAQMVATNDELSRTRAELASARNAEQQALADAQQAKAQSAALQAQVQANAQADVAAREAAEAAAAAARQEAAVTAEVEVHNDAAPPVDTQRRERRQRILTALKGTMPTLDTGRGLVITLHDDSFRGGSLRDDYGAPVARIASIIAAEPGLRVAVEGYSDSSAMVSAASERAEAVKAALISSGLPAGSVTAAGFGASRPIDSNATSEGRKANSRIEIVISGDSIGNMALWDHTYPLTSDAAAH